MKNIIFDFDGPLFNSRKIAQNTLQEIFDDMKIPTVISINNLSLTSPKKLVDSCIDKYGLYDLDSYIIAEMYYERLIKNEFLAEARENVVSVLKQLKSNNYQLFIVSDRSEQRLKEIMDNIKILPYFDEVIGRESYGLKPSQGSAKYLLEKYRVFPQTTWMVGDTENDYLYARSAGYHYAQAFYSQEPTPVPIRKFDLILNTEKDILLI